MMVEHDGVRGPLLTSSQTHRGPRRLGSSRSSVRTRPGMVLSGLKRVVRSWVYFLHGPSPFTTEVTGGIDDYVTSSRPSIPGVHLEPVPLYLRVLWQDWVYTKGISETEPLDRLSVKKHFNTVESLITWWDINEIELQMEWRRTGDAWTKGGTLGVGTGLFRTRAYEKESRKKREKIESFDSTTSNVNIIETSHSWMFVFKLTKITYLK